MIRVKEAIIVEGRYDKIKLSSVVDGLIIETGGFRIFKDKNLLAMIRRLADSRGILIMTDSDAAGFMIRNYLSGAVDPSKIKHAYIPDILGKEKRKEKPSKEGKLGVEGVPVSAIEDALKRAGISYEEAPLLQNRRMITKIDLYELGFSGREDSSYRRKALLNKLGLPEHLAVNSLVKVLNSMLSYEEFCQTVAELSDK